eukprot:254662-Pelagomonas_calceolata.AAC.4
MQPSQKLQTLSMERQGSAVCSSLHALPAWSNQAQQFAATCMLVPFMLMTTVCACILCTALAEPPQHALRMAPAKLKASRKTKMDLTGLHTTRGDPCVHYRCMQAPQAPNLICQHSPNV